MCLKEIGLCAKILGLEAQHNWGPVAPFNEDENLRFDIENHEKSVYGLDSDLLTILY